MTFLILNFLGRGTRDEKSNRSVRGRPRVRVHCCFLPLKFDFGIGVVERQNLNTARSSGVGGGGGTKKQPRSRRRLTESPSRPGMTPSAFVPRKPMTTRRDAASQAPRLPCLRLDVECRVHSLGIGRSGGGGGLRPERHPGGREASLTTL